MAQHAGYEALIPCKVVSEHGAQSDGLMLSLSSTEAMVRTEGWDGSRRLDVAFCYGGEDLRLPCDVMPRDPAWDSVLRVSFAPLTPAQHVGLRQVVAGLADEHQQSQDAPTRVISLQWWRARRRGQGNGARVA